VDGDPGAPAPTPAPVKAPDDLPLEPVGPAVDPGAPEPAGPAGPPEPSLDPLAPGVAADPAPESLAPEELPEARPVDPAGADLAPAPAPARRRRPGGFLRLHGLGEFGALPGPSGGVGLAGGLLWPRARLELHALYVAPRTAVRPQAEVRASL